MSFQVGMLYKINRVNNFEKARNHNKWYKAGQNLFSTKLAEPKEEKNDHPNF